jgi:hypothetical protein
MKLCHYCKDFHEEFDVRPYGHNGALICFKCMTSSPELEKVAKANFLAQLDAAEAASKGIVIIGEPTGPRPLNSNSLV